MSQLEKGDVRPQRLNRKIDRDAAEAERKVGPIHKLIVELGKSQLLNDAPILAGHLQCPCEAGEPHDSGQVAQAALLVPEGFGVCLWDPAQFAALGQRPDGLESNARRSFLPFNQCSATYKAFLLPFMEEMAEDLTDIRSIAASKLDGVPMTDAPSYFAKRRAESRTD